VPRADTRRKRSVVVAPAAPEAVSFSLIATGGAVRTEKISRIRAQLRHGTYHIRAAEVAKAILRNEPSLESLRRKGRKIPFVKVVE
jgi:anti-sigma28 factor (negative regulator of flagellin synthesis)